jgi:hypothetical protein
MRAGMHACNHGVAADVSRRLELTFLDVVAGPSSLPSSIPLSFAKPVPDQGCDEGCDQGNRMGRLECSAKCANSSRRRQSAPIFRQTDLIVRSGKLDSLIRGWSPASSARLTSSVWYSCAADKDDRGSRVHLLNFPFQSPSRPSARFQSSSFVSAPNFSPR